MIRAGCKRGDAVTRMRGRSYDPSIEASLEERAAGVQFLHATSFSHKSGSLLYSVNIPHLHHQHPCHPCHPCHHHLTATGIQPACPTLSRLSGHCDSISRHSV